MCVCLRRLSIYIFYIGICRFHCSIGFKRDSLLVVIPMENGLVIEMKTDRMNNCINTKGNRAIRFSFSTINQYQCLLLTSFLDIFLYFFISIHYDTLQFMCSNKAVGNDMLNHNRQVVLTSWMPFERRKKSWKITDLVVSHIWCLFWNVGYGDPGLKWTIFG